MTEIKVRVKVGTLKFEQGTFSKGDIITVTEERFKLFDPADVEAIGDMTAEIAMTATNNTQSQTITVSEIPDQPMQPKARRAK